MTIERKLLGTVDAGASQAVYIEDVMATYLYNGTDAAQTINNGIDLATKGGMVWVKCRQNVIPGTIYDTNRGATKYLQTNVTSAQTTMAEGIKSFSSTGFVLGNDSFVNGTVSVAGGTYASWTFAKQPKFFDVVTYTGNGTTQNIAHSLGVAPGMIIVKSSSITNDWTVWHRSLTSGYKLALNSTGAANNTAQNNYFGNNSAVVAPTSTQFTIGSNYNLNQSGATYVAYLFADSNSGGFGPAGTDSVVACGSFTTSGETTVNLGWEPQYVLIKRTDAAQDWYVFDNMRGMSVNNSNNYLLPNSSSAEASTTTSYYGVKPTATGFVAQSLFFGNGYNYIYLAIRRGPMKTPTDATKVFAPVAYTGSGAGQTVTTGMPVDLTIVKSRSGAGTSNEVWDRLRGSGEYLLTDSTAARDSFADQYKNDSNTGIKWALSDGWSNINGSTFGSWNFRRAPGFFDVVCYTGNGQPNNGLQVDHTLTVVPEMIIAKKTSSTSDWFVWHKNGTQDRFSTAILNNNFPYDSYGSSVWGDIFLSVNMSATQFTVGGTSNLNSASTYVAYLFATCPGVSKVGSYTGNGSSQTIDCGFTSGARFVLIKRTDGAGDWYVWDTARGIVAGNDPHLSLNSTAAEVTTNDTIDPASSGFIVNQVAATNVNASSATYIYLAIA